MVYFVKFRGSNKIYSQRFWYLESARVFARSLNRRAFIVDKDNNILCRFNYGREVTGNVYFEV